MVVIGGREFGFWPGEGCLSLLTVSDDSYSLSAYLTMTLLGIGHLLSVDLTIG